MKRRRNSQLSPDPPFINLMSLTCIQVANVAMPLVVFPYVLSIVGTYFYAKLVVAEAIAQFTVTMVLYSFELDGVASVVGLHSDRDRTMVSRIFSEILICRALIFFTCAALIIVVVTVFERSALPLFLSWLLVPLSFVLQPAWLYQGLQKNSALAFFSLASRLLAIALVLATVRSPFDYTLVPLLIGTVYLASALTTMFVAMRMFGIWLVPVRPQRIREVFWLGRQVFFGNASVMLYKDMNVIMLGSMGVSAPGIAAYSLAEKTVKGLQAAMRPLNQLFLPRVLLISQRAGQVSRQVFEDVFRLVTPQLMSLAGIVAVVAVTYVAAKDYLPAIQQIPNLARVETLVSIMLWATFFGVVNFMLGMAGLNSLNERNYYFKCVLTSGAAGALICLLLIRQWGEFAAAANFVLSEVLLFILVVRKYTHQKGGAPR